jgi:hypothetical protein
LASNGLSDRPLLAIRTQPPPFRLIFGRAVSKTGYKAQIGAVSLARYTSPGTDHFHAYLKCGSGPDRTPTFSRCDASIRAYIVHSADNENALSFGSITSVCFRVGLGTLNAVKTACFAPA